MKGKKTAYSVVGNVTNKIKQPGERAGERFKTSRAFKMVGDYFYSFFFLTQGG